MYSYARAAARRPPPSSPSHFLHHLPLRCVCAPRSRKADDLDEQKLGPKSSTGTCVCEESEECDHKWRFGSLSVLFLSAGPLITLGNPNSVLGDLWKEIEPTGDQKSPNRHLCHNRQLSPGTEYKTAKMDG